MISQLTLALSVNQSLKWIVISLFALMAVLETVAPRRKLQLPTGRRWFLHCLLYLSTAVSFPLIFGVGSVALAASLEGSPYGILNRQEIPYALRFGVWLLLADLCNYAQHRLFHGVAWLWRLHLVHHSDRDIDFTNQFRFHPLEGVVSRLGGILAILLLAPPPMAVAAYEVLAIAAGLLGHANLRLPAGLERQMRRLLVTPDLHQIHHSRGQSEQGQNLGTLFVCWDRLFGTYLASPAAGMEALEFGVEEVEPADCIRLRHLLCAPFRGLLKRPVQAKASFPR